MATPSEKLAEALERLKELQDQGVIAIKSEMLSRVQRERLLKNRFIEEVYRGWYISIPPNVAPGNSTGWYINYWGFCSQNIESRFGANWCVSPEQSILLHVGNNSVPKQLVVRNEIVGSNIISFPHNTSLIIIKSPIPNHNNREIINGIRVYKLPLAIVQCAEVMFRSNPIEMRTALSLIRSSSEVLEHLLDGGKSTIAGRLAGAFKNIGMDSIAEEIIKTMKSTDYDVRETDPFEIKLPALGYQRLRSPYEIRIKYMWQSMREKVISIFPEEPGIPTNNEEYINAVNEIYVTDAYHSLSIEKYNVTPELIDKVRNGAWNPESDENDRNSRNAMAAKGYWAAFQATLKSIQQILEGKNPGTVLSKEHGDWYRELFSASVSAGILKASDLAGYRNNQVYIDGSLHTPLNIEAVRDTMPVLFELIENEPEASVRTVLGHFIFVYIHPYMDGNGRIGRFIMNAMLASGGYPWTVIPVEQRKAYMQSLEKASVDGNIEPFALFIAELVKQGMQGKPVATLQVTK